ncbi:MAG: hypothetical protein RPU59_13920 [Candidatus Sedimenticola sp. (ex Thyasira tokunagai)]
MTTKKETAKNPIKGKEAPDNSKPEELEGGEQELESQQETPEDEDLPCIPFGSCRSCCAESEVTDMIAQALLSNPEFPLWIGGNPLNSPGRPVEDSSSIGAYLARASRRIAIDYLEEIDRMKAVERKDESEAPKTEPAK